MTSTRMRAKVDFAHSYADDDGATIRRATWDIGAGDARVRDGDRLYSRRLQALHYWDQGRLVIRRSAEGQGTFAVRYRTAGGTTWADAMWGRALTREPGTRDEEWIIGIGGDIELQVEYTAASPGGSDTVHHMILYTPPRVGSHSLVEQPRNISPPHMATNVGQTPVLQGSPYRHMYGVPQKGVRLRVATDPSFSNVILDTSTDFLASWVAISQAETTEDLTAVALGGDGQGTAVGDAGAIIATADGGETWTAETAAGTANLHCIAQTATMRLTGGANGTLEQSTHDGSAWSAWAALTLAGGATATVRGVAVVGVNIVAVGDGGMIQASNDGGTFFASRTADDSYTGPFNAVAMDGSGNCIAVGGAGEIQTSGDFGVTWQHRAVDETYTDAWRAVAMDDAGNALIVGETGVVQTSADYGATWAGRTTADGGAFTGTWGGVVLTGAGAAVAVGTSGEIQTSEDGGVTWYARDAAGAYADAFAGVAIGASGDAVIVGAAGEIQRANRLDAAATTFTVPAGDDMLETGKIYWWDIEYQDEDEAV